MSQARRKFSISDLPFPDNQADLHLMPTDLLKRIFELLNALQNLEVRFGRVSRQGDKVYISIDDPRLTKLEEIAAQLSNNYLDLQTDANGNLVVDPNGRLGTNRVDGNQGGLLGDRNDFGTDFSGGTGSGGSTGGSPTGSGGSNSESTDNGGGGTSDINPEGTGARVVAQVSTTSPQLVAGTVTITANATVYNFTGVEVTSTTWKSLPVTGEQAGEVVDFTFTEAGQYILTFTAVIDGTSYSDTVRVTVLSEDSVTVSAGADLSLDLDVSETLNLAGSVVGGTLLWRQASGSAVAIDDPASPTTQVTFQQPGTYRFAATLVEDPTKTDDMVVTVSGGEPLTVTANPEQTSTYAEEFPATAQLRAYVSNGAASIQWTQIGGVTASISSANSAIATATMPSEGWYKFRITATLEGSAKTADVSVYAGKIGSGDQVRLIYRANKSVLWNFQSPGIEAFYIDGVYQPGAGAASGKVCELTTPRSLHKTVRVSGDPENPPSSIVFEFADPGATPPVGGGALIVGIPWQGEGIYSTDGTYTPGF